MHAAPALPGRVPRHPAALRSARSDRMSRRLLIAICAGSLCLSRVAAAEPDFNFFETKIRPVLVERCYECHGEKKQKGGLRLDGKAALLKGGDSGPIVVPG